MHVDSVEDPTNIEQSSSISNNVNSTEDSKKIYVWGNHVNGELGVGGIEDDYLSTPTPLGFSDKVVTGNEITFLYLPLACCGRGILSD